MSPKLSVVGGGRMGEALVAGLLGSGWAKSADLAVAEPVAARRRELSRRYAGLSVSAAPVAAEGTVLAVKPGDAEAACRAVVRAADSGKLGRVLSIAAGVPIARLESWLGAGAAVVRAMPNTPALVGAGAAAIAGGATSTTADLDWAEEILGSVGTVVRVGEGMLDAVTGLSGSGPAYLLLVAEALIEAGVLAGLPYPTSAALVGQLLAGTARLVQHTAERPEALRSAVTSPGGTTAAGIRALEAAGVRGAFMEAVMAATARSRQLGAEF
ncbi:MAG: pyrroline-5-carboxylate reductase [Acidimicrobiales bacterium]